MSIDGTIFDNQLLVIARTGSTTQNVLTGNVASILELCALLEAYAMKNKQQDTRIQLANEIPLNQAAMAFLPKDWGEEGEIAVLSLMRWAMDNGMPSPQLDPSHPDTEQLRTQINLMTGWNPADVIGFLTNPEQLEGEEILSAEELTAEPTPEDAAGLLLRLLYEAMVVTAP